MPPGPTKDTRRTSGSPSIPTTAASSSSRPRKGVAGTGRFVRWRLRIGGNSPAPSWNTRSGALKSLNRCSPRSISSNDSGSSSETVEGDSTTCPPCAALMILAARCTSMPTYLGGSRAGSPVWMPTRMRIGPVSKPDHRLAHRRYRVLGAGESVEEGVSLIVHLVALVAATRRAHNPPVLAERLAVGVRTQFVEQSGRPLDVREHQGHGPGRLRVAHPARLSLRGRDDCNAASNPPKAGSGGAGRRCRWSYALVDGPLSGDLRARASRLRFDAKEEPRRRSCPRSMTRSLSSTETSDPLVRLAGNSAVVRVARLRRGGFDQLSASRSRSL